MFNMLFMLFFASEFCYYLLIAQTGIVEVFGSDISLFFTLPLGGIIGSLLVYKNVWRFDNDQRKITLFLAIQTICSLFYPHLTLFVLFILGLSLGASAPLLINMVRGRLLETAVGLGITYAIGTTLFTYPSELRGNLAILLSVIAFVTSFFTCKEEKEELIPLNNMSLLSIASMSIWAFLDANLFETLSRSAAAISIWRGQEWYLILIFHIVGIVMAYVLRDRLKEHNLLIALLFTISYMLYAANENIMLSIVYPFVISYYNFVIIQRLSSLKNLKFLGVIMVFTGWIAGGSGLMSALNSLTFIGALFIVGLLSVEFYRLSQKIINQTLSKRINHVS